MKKILAFGASSNRNSINKTFANFAANPVKETQVKVLDLSDLEMPIFSIDREMRMEFTIWLFSLRRK